MEEIEKLQNKVNQLKCDMMAHLSRAHGMVWVVNAAKLPETVTPEQFLKGMRNMEIVFMPADSQKPEPAIEEIDFRINEDQCIELIREIRKAQDEMAEIGRNLKIKTPETQQ